MKTYPIRRFYRTIIGVLSIFGWNMHIFYLDTCYKMNPCGHEHNDRNPLNKEKFINMLKSCILLITIKIWRIILFIMIIQLIGCVKSLGAWSPSGIIAYYISSVLKKMIFMNDGDISNFLLKVLLLSHIKTKFNCQLFILMPNFLP